MNNEFTIQKNTYIMEEKEKIEKNFKTMEENEIEGMKIKKSKEMNQLKIEKMRKINEYVEMLKKDTIAEIRN